MVSHASAAALWSLPLPLQRGVPLSVWLTAPPNSGCAPRRDGRLVLEVAGLPAAEVVSLRASRYGHDVAVTAPARTVADCLRHLDAADAVAVADAAAGRGLTRAQLVAAVARQVAWPRSAAARAALSLVDPRRESWLESASRVGLASQGLPPPEPQVVVRTPGSRFVARVDGLWRVEGVVGEADGWAKYRDRSTTAAAAEQALRAEKQREDALRDLGLEVVRWGVSGVTTPPGLARTSASVRRAVARGDRLRVTAVLQPTPLPAGW